MSQLLSRALVSINWLSQALKTCKPGPSLRVLDASFYYPPIRDGRKEYEEKHIPGALYFDIDECKDKTSPYEVMLPSESHFAKYVGNLGINNDSHVVIYDADQMGIYYSARAWYMFRVFGHKKVSVLNGGFRNWVKQGLPVTSEVVKPKPESYRAVLNPSLVKTYEDIQRNVKTKEYQLVDSRSEGRYKGTEPEPGEVISLPTPKSAPPYTFHPQNEKHQKNSTECYNVKQRMNSSQSEHLGKRRNTSQEHVTFKQEDTRVLVPANIRHKYGSSVVDKLISPERVRSHLREDERTEYQQGYCIPRLRENSCFLEDYPHKIYYGLGHCLRSNLFPGAPIIQNSLVHDSYTAEVNEKGRLEKWNTHQWYGRKTDDLAIWSELLMKRKAIAKILQSQPKPSHVFPIPIRTNVPKDLPPPPPPPRKTSKKPRKQIHQAKSEKPEVQPSLVSPPKEEDDFWDFYDKPI